MSEALGVQAAAVKNVLKRPIKLTYAARTLQFEPGEIKIVSEAACNHALLRQHGEEVNVEVQKGVFQKQIQVLRPFKRVSLEEAQKAGVKFDENPELAHHAKAEADKAAAKRAERAEWEKDFKDRFLADLKKEGLVIAPAAKVGSGVEEGAEQD